MCIEKGAAPCEFDLELGVVVVIWRGSVLVGGGMFCVWGARMVIDNGKWCGYAWDGGVLVS